LALENVTIEPRKCLMLQDVAPPQLELIVIAGADSQKFMGLGSAMELLRHSRLSPMHLGMVPWIDGHVVETAVNEVGALGAGDELPDLAR